MKNKDQLLIIFVKNPEEGRVKTRLAKKTGNKVALNIYKELLSRTVSTTKRLEVSKTVYYSNEIPLEDLWKDSIFNKGLQQGADLGERMENAFLENFSKGFRQIVLIGSDIYDLQENDILQAFEALKQHDIVFGPAMDGGYYLLGMNSLTSEVFRNKDWGTSSVLESSLKDLENKKVFLLKKRQDIDEYEDLKNKPEFRKYLKNE